jgi:hypothetical protein
VCARGHRMAVPADGRCLRRGRAGSGVSAPGLPGVRRTDDVLVGPPAARLAALSTPEPVRPCSPADAEP